MPDTPEDRKTLILTGAFGLLLVFSLLFATDASAQLLPGKVDCKFSNDFAAYFPLWSTDDVENFKGGAVEVCSYSYKAEHNDNSSARLFLPPKLGAGGVCSLPSVDLYLVHNTQGHLVLGEPPKDEPSYVRRDRSDPLIAMTPGSDPCPPPGDPRYINTQNMPEGVFLALLQLWRNVFSEPSNLDRYLIGEPIWRPEVFAKFREALATNRDALKLVRVSMPNSEIGGSILGRNDPNYRAGQIELQIEDGPGFWFLVGVDYTASGFKIVSVNEMMA